MRTLFFAEMSSTAKFLANVPLISDAVWNLLTMTYVLARHLVGSVVLEGNTFEHRGKISTMVVNHPFVFARGLVISGTSCCLNTMCLIVLVYMFLLFFGCFFGADAYRTFLAGMVCVSGLVYLLRT